MDEASAYAEQHTHNLTVVKSLTRQTDHSILLGDSANRLRGFRFAPVVPSIGIPRRDLTEMTI